MGKRGSEAWLEKVLGVSDLCCVANMVRIGVCNGESVEAWVVEGLGRWVPICLFTSESRGPVLGNLSMAERRYIQTKVG